MTPGSLPLYIYTIALFKGTVARDFLTITFTKINDHWPLIQTTDVFFIWPQISRDIFENLFTFWVWQLSRLQKLTSYRFLHLKPGKWEHFVPHNLESVYFLGYETQKANTFRVSKFLKFKIWKVYTFQVTKCGQW